MLTATPAASLASAADGQAPAPAAALKLGVTLLGTGTPSPSLDRQSSGYQIDQPGVREQIVHEIQKVFEGKVIWGEDLMRLTPAGARVSAIESRQG